MTTLFTVLLQFVLKVRQNRRDDCCNRTVNATCEKKTFTLVKKKEKARVVNILNFRFNPYSTSILVVYIHHHDIYLSSKGMVY